MAYRPRFVVGNSRDGASAEDYKHHLAYELAVILKPPSVTQQSIADQIDVEQSSISKVLRGEKPMALKEAEGLDDAGFVSTIDIPFATLVAEHVALRRAEKRRILAQPVSYDVFLASPMAAAGKSYIQSRTRVLELHHALEAKGLTTFYAGLDIPTKEDFDTQEIAFEVNMKALHASTQLVLYLPEPTPKSTKPSSVWVEVGIALEREMPCTFMVSNASVLPYIVQRAYIEQGREGRRLVDVLAFGDDPYLPINRVRRNGPRVLAGGH